MPKRYPEEFKRDVVAVARRGDLTVLEVATDFGVVEETVRRWMRQTDIDEGIKDGMTGAEQSDLVRLTCGVLGFSTQEFYAWSKNPVSLRDLEDAYAINALDLTPFSGVVDLTPVCGPGSR